MAKKKRNKQLNRKTRLASVTEIAFNPIDWIIEVLLVSATPFILSGLIQLVRNGMIDFIAMIESGDLLLCTGTVAATSTIHMNNKSGKRYSKKQGSKLLFALSLLLCLLSVTFCVLVKMSISFPINNLTITTIIIIISTFFTSYMAERVL